jgi:hypothetical protein
MWGCCRAHSSAASNGVELMLKDGQIGPPICSSGPQDGA